MQLLQKQVHLIPLIPCRIIYKSFIIYISVDPVEQITFQEIESQFQISWFPSIRTKSCIKYYKWKYFLDDKCIQKFDVHSTDVIIEKPNGCFNSTFSILAAINDSFLSPPQSKTYMDIKGKLKN